MGSVSDSVGTHPSPPPCPRCGVSMTQRKNRTSGEPFWGCSDYPACRGTRPFGDLDGDGIVGTRRELRWPPRVEGQRWPSPKGFEDARRVVIPGSGRNDISRRRRAARAAWNHVAVLFPRGHASVRPVLSSPVATVLHVARRILLRGECPPIEPELREALAATDEHESLPFDQNYRVRWRSPDGSHEEEQTFELLASRLTGAALPAIHPQAPIAGLIEGYDPARKSRVDFAIVHPGMRRGIVVEIDGQQHEEEEQEISDKERDALLTEGGYDVIRVSTDEISAGVGPGFLRLCAALDSIPPWPSQESAPLVSAHAQLALLELVEEGILGVGVEEWRIATSGHWSDALAAGLQSVVRLLRALDELYGTQSVAENVGVDSKGHLSNPDVTLDCALEVPWWAPPTADFGLDAVTVELRPMWLPVLPPLPPPPHEWVSPRADATTESLRTILRFYSPDKSDFWEGQEEALRRCLAGDDTLVLLPTGAGKSLIYQLASALFPGLVLVIAPLIALMDDQVDNLERAGVDRVVAISSRTTHAGKTADLQARLRTGIFELCYISPERLQMDSFRKALRAVSAQVPVPLVVIDEAHCLSEWGHDFRPAYLNIARVSREFGRRGTGDSPAIVGLTGTASRAVLRDLQNELGIMDLRAVVTPQTFDRSELHFEVLHVESSAKIEALEGVLRRIGQHIGVRQEDVFHANDEGAACGVVFCPHTRGPFGVDQVAKELERRLRVRVARYHGRMTPAQRELVARRFKDDEHSLLVATKAFGMGIDKPNVRYTAHFGLTSSLESFYQEAGRAGRDRRPALCAMLASCGSRDAVERLLDPRLDVEQLEELRSTIPRSEEDDIARMLWFHTNSFKGILFEVEQVERLARILEPIDSPGLVAVPFDALRSAERGGRRGAGGRARDDAQKGLERAIHRLVVLNVIVDYTLDYSKGIASVVKRAASVESIRGGFVHHVRTYSPARADKLLANLPPTKDQNPAS